MNFSFNECLLKKLSHPISNNDVKTLGFVVKVYVEMKLFFIKTHLVNMKGKLKDVTKKTVENFHKLLILTYFSPYNSLIISIPPMQLCFL